MLVYIILGVILGLPLLLGIIFRVNTSFLFFSMLAGELLSRYFADDAELVTRLVVRNPAIQPYVELGLLVIPVILTALFLRNTLSKGKIFIYIIPYLVTGFVLAAFALPMLPDPVQSQIRTVQIGERLLEGHETIVGAVVFVQLITLWLMNRSHGHGKKHH